MDNSQEALSDQPWGMM